jgi:hypothetical protein
MVLKNHIAYRFLTDEELTLDMIEAHMPGIIDKFLDGEHNLTDREKSQLKTLNDTISPIDQEAFYITDTIVDKIGMLKTKPQENGHYDWKVFNHLPDQKKTFIYSNNSLIRVSIRNGFLCFCWIDAKKSEKSNGFDLEFHLFNLEQKTQRFSSNWEINSYVGELEEKIFRLLCFFYLAENEMIIVEPGKKYGTKKAGKLINTFENIPVTIVNSNWNITSIRTEGFSVSGHFRLQPCGPGLTETKLILIEPFEKNGYVRKAKNFDHI